LEKAIGDFSGWGKELGILFGWRKQLGIFSCWRKELGIVFAFQLRNAIGTTSIEGTLYSKKINMAINFN
jgi:hypothetical protein